MKSTVKMTPTTQTSVIPSSLQVVKPSRKVRTLPQPSLPSGETKTIPQRQGAWHVAPNLVVSFKYAWAGISYAFVTQRNFRLHTFVTVLAISLSLILNLPAVEMSIIALTCALVMVLELLNTALESVVDLTVGHSYHELAKIAKDCAAGSVMIAALAAVFVASFTILPPLMILILSWR